MRDKGRAENKKRILIINVDPDICMPLSEILKDNGFAADYLLTPIWALLT
jgi:DNA-binding response OmpR family regulator